jgi:hypothetical protein
VCKLLAAQCAAHRAPRLIVRESGDYFLIGRQRLQIVYADRGFKILCVLHEKLKFYLHTLLENSIK